MKEELDKIEWSKLTHAYGSAEDVPSLLLDLLSDEQRVRDEAIQELFKNIYHQGTIYKATEYAIPFLINILANRHSADIEESVLGLLASIAAGNCRGVSKTTIIARLTSGKTVFQKYLNSNTIELKVFAIQILSKLRVDKSYLIKRIEDEIELSTNEESLIHLYLGLYLSKGGQIDTRRLQSLFDKAENKTLKLLFACFIIKSSPSKKHKKIIECLLSDYFQEDKKLEKILCYWPSDLLYSIEDIILSLENKVLKPYYQQLKSKELFIRQIQDKGNRPYKLTDYFCLLCKAVFNKKIDFGNLNEEQTEVLNKLRTFYRPTENEVYNSWLKSEMYTFHSFISDKFIVDVSFEEFRSLLEEE